MREISKWVKIFSGHRLCGSWRVDGEIFHFPAGKWGVAAIFSPRRRNKWRQFPRKAFFSTGSDDADDGATIFFGGISSLPFPEISHFFVRRRPNSGIPTKTKYIFSILRFIAHFSFDVKQFFRWEKNAIAWTVNPFLFLWNGPPGRKGKKRNLGSTSLQLQEICHRRNCLVDRRSPQKESRELKKKKIFVGNQPTSLLTAAEDSDCNSEALWLPPLHLQLDCTKKSSSNLSIFSMEFLRTCVCAFVELFAKAESHSRTELAGNAIWSISSPETHLLHFLPHRLFGMYRKDNWKEGKGGFEKHLYLIFSSPAIGKPKTSRIWLQSALRALKEINPCARTRSPISKWNKNNLNLKHIFLEYRIIWECWVFSSLFLFCVYLWGRWWVSGDPLNHTREKERGERLGWMLNLAPVQKRWREGGRDLSGMSGWLGGNRRREKDSWKLLQSNFEFQLNT